MPIGCQFSCHLRLIKVSIDTFAIFVVPIISRSENCRHGCLLPRILRLPVALGLAIISRNYIGLVIIPALLQPFYIRPLVSVIATSIFFAIDQAGIYPAMNHVIHGLRGARLVIHRQPVNKAAASNSQGNVTFLGFNLADPHIAASFSLGQVNAALSLCVDLRTRAIRSVNQIRSRNANGLTCCANTTIFAGQRDSPAFNGHTTARLRDIARSIQRHIP